MTTYLSHAILFGLMLLGLATGPSVAEVAQFEIEDILGSFINVIIGQRQNNENGTFDQFKDRALNDKSNDEIYDSTTQEIIERSGFKQKTYQVMSPDGYITPLVNIINPLADERHLKRPPVALFHGLACDTSSWIWANSIQHHPEKYPRNVTEDGPITSYNRSLGFMLANNGFDVWLVGTRGRESSLGHARMKVKLLDDFLADLIGHPETFDENVKQFFNTFRYFDYSLDELTEHEFPQQIRAILKLTGSKKVNVVAMSVATSIMFKILVSNRSIADKIHSYVPFIPVLNEKGTNLFVKAVFEIVPKIPQPIFTIVSQIVFSRFLRNTLRSLSRYGLFKLLSTLVVGASPKYLTFLEEPVIGHSFMSTGSKEVQHYCRQTKVGKLQKFDYGPAKNVQIYGSSSPPVYDLTKFKLKRWMIVSGVNDALGTQNSVDEYVRQIPIKPYKVIRNAEYNHLDAFAAFDNDIKVNLPILEFFDRFQTK